MRRILIILFLLGGLITAQAQVVPGGIIHALETGDAKELAGYFHTNIELKLLKEEYVTSKNQSTRILQDFFEDYPPRSFKISEDDKKQETNYAYGTLTTRKGTFRVNMYFLEGKKEKTIYFLSVEKI